QSGRTHFPPQPNRSHFPTTKQILSPLKEYQQKNSPGLTPGAKKKRKGKEGSRPETPTNDGRESPENVSGLMFWNLPWGEGFAS
uniref:Uncharacterized protein n=1 Tax=Anolis carolinensis TaxID=28377 RepID=A0A803SRC3_ANOCA